MSNNPVMVVWSWSEVRTGLAGVWSWTSDAGLSPDTGMDQEVDTLWDQSYITYSKHSGIFKNCGREGL